MPYKLLAGDMLAQLISRYVLEEGPIAKHPLLKGVQFKVGVEVDDDFRASPPIRKMIEGDRWRKISTNMLAASLAKKLNHPPEGWGIVDRKLGEKDVMKRVWSPSIPVAHLGMALLGYITTDCGNTVPEMETLLEGNWMESVLLNAEMNRQLAIRMGLIKKAEANMVQLLFEEGSGKIPSPSTPLDYP